MRSDEVARRLDAGDACGALGAAHVLQQQTIAAINAREVPAALQEPLASAATRLAAGIRCNPAPAPVPPAARDTGKPKHGKGKDKGKHGDGAGD